MEKFAEIRVQVPTVHVVGTKDPHRPFGLDLIELCDRKVRQTIDHVMGHEIPRDNIATEAIRNAVEWAVRMSNVGG